MKIPIIPFYKIERAVRMLPIIKEVFASNRIEDPKTIKKLEDDLWNKKAEICTLRQKIKDLEEKLNNCNYLLLMTSVSVDKER